MRALTWFAFLGPPAAWTLHLVVGYGIEEVACSPGQSLPVEPLIAGVTGVAALTAAAAGLAGLVLWRRAGRGDLPDPRGRVAFMGAGGGIAGVIFVVLILVGGLQIIGLDSCASG